MDINEQFLNKIFSNTTDKDHISVFKSWVVDFDEEPLLKTTDQLFNKEQFLKQALFNSYDKTSDCYFSINTFRKQRRITDDIWHLNAFVLDFDFYKIKSFSQFDPTSFYQDILKANLDIMPTAVIDSGRGLYIIYCFRDCPKSMLKTYKAIYHKLFDKFKYYGLDPKAMNATQLIRLPGTINSKTNTEVSILEFNDTDYKISDFYYLFNLTREQVNEYKSKKKKRLVNIKELNNTINNYNKKKVFFNKFIKDIKNLIKLRNMNNQNDGYRELLIFLVRRRAKWAGYSIDKEIEIAMNINELFNESLTENEVIITAKPCGYTKCPSVKRMIYLLQISNEEMKHLRLLVDNNTRINNSNKRKKRNKLLNMTDKQITIKKRRLLVAHLKNEGYKNNYIAKAVSCSKSTVTKDLAYIKKHAYAFIVDLKRQLKQVLTDNEKEEIVKNWTGIKVEFNSLE